MSPMEDVKRVAEKATGWKRPDDPQALLRDRKPQTYRFKDDGLIPNHPTWPLVIYKNPVRLPQSLDPAAYSKSCLTAMVGEIHGATASTTMSIIIRASTRSSA
jgi:hypothetical protein